MIRLSGDPSWGSGCSPTLRHIIAVTVVTGVLQERFRVTGERVARQMSEGSVVALPCDHVHEIRNLTGLDAVSVHVYSPPITTLGFYDGNGNTRLSAPD